MSEEKKKAEMIFKTFRTIVIKTGDEEGVIDMLIPMSTGSIDRSGESIDPKGWKKHLKAFKKRAIMTSSHNYRGLQNQIGEFLDLQIVEKGLLARPKYYINQGNSEADWGYFLATKGKAAYSVGFIPIKWEDSDGKEGKPTRKFTEQELIEIAHVIVPSNRDAVQGLQAKSEYKETDPIIKDIIDEVLEDKDFFIGEGEDINLIGIEKEVITKPEETDDFIRLPVKGEEGKHKGHKIRWINVSTKKGIRGIYCIDDKKVITYVFAKDKDWTMAKAKKWMEDNGKMVSDYFEKTVWDGTDAQLDDIDWETVLVNIDKDDKLEKMIDKLKFYPEIKYIIINDEEFDEKDKDFEAMAMRFAEKYLFFSKRCKELERKVKDIELKAGAVLNAKNKKDLKTAQALIQSVLDSAGEEEGQEGKEVKDNEKDDIVITLTGDKKEDPGKEEAKEEKTIIVDEKIIAETITKTMNHILGITDK